jgi:2-polyprenyl-3-methyl-5-hydroxy-6-metoxy-1,4-benzoquinol methylase
MKEEDIRPEKLNQIVLSLHRQDVKEILKFRNEFVSINCPACNSPKYKKSFLKNGFNFVRCSLCETLFINPRPNIKMLNTYYSQGKSNKFWNDNIFPSTEEVRRIQIFQPRAKMVATLCKKIKMKKRILADVGAGFGTFCEEIDRQKVFSKVVAVEPGHDAAGTISKKGFKVYESPIEYVKNLKADVITCFELIEHLFKPEDFIKACQKSLTSGGYLIITTPNAKGFDMSILGKLSDHADGPDHLNLFNPQSITALLERSGLKVERLLTPGKLDAEIVRKKILSGALGIPSNSFLQQILVERWDKLGNKIQRFISSNNLSSHMLILAKKVV